MERVRHQARDPQSVDREDSPPHVLLKRITRNWQCCFLASWEYSLPQPSFLKTSKPPEANGQVYKVEEILKKTESNFHLENPKSCKNIQSCSKNNLTCYQSLSPT
ncbi:hypothetical protein BDBG_16700 [Blastomyces gilchristii SLH14081]|uniref:Uncharacterized protein n=1 Tax=Blastomyces gilchristii (strain SLH14081) TaxID=559298 RepID=A0A179UG30_BLAGS|nr:uncharacterized protein BDBG_16700 [Blastomyces gilchristii SLH14081]EQL33730.1 hypothetical protein BDFG_04266 [Blastomyces dermatitidis ATCC 26199]OAT06800.1 hypothetical protein BDBG_16700 [Blastomyces gilchristii SLH14081]